MADAVDSLRHPRLESIVAVWRTLRAAVDLTDDTLVLEVPDPPTKDEVAAYGLFLERPAAQAVRALILNSGIQALAKALEANHGSDLCRQVGASASSLLLAYDAAYLSARSLCLLLGFAPVNRESAVSVDVLSSYGTTTPDPVEDNFAFFNYGRWGHSNMWTLAGRLTRTMKRSETIEPNLKVLRSDKLEQVSKLRNQQIYGTRRLYNGDSPEDADFPDLIPKDQADTMTVCKRYSDIYRNLTAISLRVIQDAGLEAQLESVASERRRKLAA